MEEKTFIIDGHVHLYPCYDWHKAVSCLVSNLQATAAQSGDRYPVVVGLLAESNFCNFFSHVSDSPEGISQGSLNLKVDADPDCVLIRNEGRIQGYLIAGRQVITAERLEILSLGARARIDDGLPADATVMAITAAGAIPVLSWSPGKWFGRRGSIIRGMIEKQPPARFLTGDTGLRPVFWPFPRLMKVARRRGFKVIGGSDALPLPGEEKWIGTYGVRVVAEFDTTRPAASLRRILADPSSSFAPVGKRAGTAAFLTRWTRNQVSRSAKSL